MIHIKKHFLSFIIIFILAVSPLFALGRAELGINMGGIYPDSDNKVRETFGSDFYFQSMLGFLDSSGWEVRANLGQYSNLSHNAADIGKNFRIDITPLTGSLIYNFNSAVSPTSDLAVIQPYIGAGAGAYFYSLQDDLFGNLESGTKFGFNFILGVRYNFNDHFFLNAEYNKRFIPRIFFNNSNNYNTSEVTIGLGFFFPTVAQTRQQYRFSSEEEDLLMRIQQLTTEINEMKQKRTEMQTEIDHFYTKTEYDEKNPQFAKELQRINFLENKLAVLDRQIATASDNLSALEQQWDTLYRNNRPIQENIIYLRSNYIYSPHGVIYKRGYLIYRDRPYTPRFYRAEEYVPPRNGSATPPAKKVEDKEQFLQKKKEHIEDLKNR